MRFECSINTNIVGKGNPSLSGWENVKVSQDELAEIVKLGFAFSPAILKEGHDGSKHSKKDVKGSQMFAIDIDDPIMRFDEIQQDEYFQEYGGFAYTTPSHTEDHNRYRL